MWSSVTHSDEEVLMSTWSRASAAGTGWAPHGQGRSGWQALRWGSAVLFSFILAPRDRWRGLKGAFSVFSFSAHSSVAVHLIAFWI